MYLFVKFQFRKEFIEQVQSSHPEWIAEFSEKVKRYAIYSSVVGKNVEAALKEKSFDDKIERLTEELNEFFLVTDIWEYVERDVQPLTTVRIMPRRDFLDELKDAEAYVHDFAEGLRKLEGICYLKHSPVHIDLQVIEGNEIELMQAIEAFNLEYLKMSNPYNMMEFEVTEQKAASCIQKYIKDYCK